MFQGVSYCYSRPSGFRLLVSALSVTLPGRDPLLPSGSLDIAIGGSLGLCRRVCVACFCRPAGPLPPGISVAAYYQGSMIPWGSVGASLPVCVSCASIALLCLKSRPCPLSHRRPEQFAADPCDLRVPAGSVWRSSSIPEALPVRMLCTLEAGAAAV